MFPGVSHSTKTMYMLLLKKSSSFSSSLVCCCKSFIAKDWPLDLAFFVEVDFFSAFFSSSGEFIGVVSTTFCSLTAVSPILINSIVIYS